MIRYLIKISHGKYINFIKAVNLIRQFTILYYKRKDQSTIFGLLWSFLHPLLMLLVLFLVFNKGFGGNIKYYPIFLLIGIIQYNYFVTATGIAMLILSNESYLTKNVIFPKETLVISSILSSTIEFIFELLICIIIATLIGVQINTALLFVPIIVILEFLLVLWVGLFLSAIHVFIKDIAHIWQIFSRMLFFATPIFFSKEFIESPILNFMLLLNPLAHLIDFGRNSIIYGHLPSHEHILLFFTTNIILFIVAYNIFKQYERLFAEYL